MQVKHPPKQPTTDRTTDPVTPAMAGRTLDQALPSSAIKACRLTTRTLAMCRLTCVIAVVSGTNNEVGCINLEALGIISRPANSGLRLQLNPLLLAASVRDTTTDRAPQAQYRCSSGLILEGRLPGRSALALNLTIQILATSNISSSSKSISKPNAGTWVLLLQ